MTEAESGLGPPMDTVRTADEALDNETFELLRSDVLKIWPTGADVDLDEAVAYHKSLAPSRRFPTVLSEGASQGCVLIQPRAGVALLDEHIELLRYLQDESDLLPTTIDSYTRQNRYEEAADGIRRSREAGVSLLNGFPAVNHGVAACRKVIEACDKPIEVRHGTPESRLLAEITLAAGFTSFEGGGISYNIPYAKSISPEKSLYDWQYVDRLVGEYEQRGVRINREQFGPLSGTLVPPLVGHTVAIVEGLLALTQGVKSITIGYGQGGNLIQDVAAMCALRELGEECFTEAGFSDYELTTVFHQWMGGFPEDEAKAFAIIALGSAVAAISGASKVIVKTPHEAFGVPTKEANLQGVLATRQSLNMLSDQNVLSGLDIADEVGIIKKEVRFLLKRLYELGEGDLFRGTAAGVREGVIDVPFAPSIYNRGRLLPVRDNDGAIRILDWGDVPMDDEVASFHREKLQERALFEKRKPSFQMVSDDIYAVSKGRLVGRPR